MKKQFDLFGLKKFDNMVDNDDADLNLRDQFYSQSVKEIKQRRKQNKRVDIYIVFFTFFLLVLFAVAIALSAIGVPMQAEAAEEQVTANETIYSNYTLVCNNAPVFFQYPEYNPTDTQLTNFAAQQILGRLTVGGTSSRYTDMIYVLKHRDGTIYYQSIVRITNTPGIFMDFSNGTYLANYNSTVGVTWPSTLSFTRLNYTEHNIYSINPTYSTQDNYKLKFFYSSIPGNVFLDDLVLSAINLRDYLFYAYNPNPYTNNVIFSNGAPWLDFTFTSDTPNERQIQVSPTDITITQTPEPQFPIIQSYDSIFNYGYNQGYNSGYNTAYDQGYNSGFEVGSDTGYTSGFNNGYNAGEDAGFNQGVLESNDYSFLGLFTAAIDAPVTVLREMFNFNFLGFNITTFIFSILTICLVIAILKKLV